MSDSVDPDLLLMVRDGLADTVPFARHAGVVIDEIADGSAVTSLPPATEILNHVATVHAGALFTLAETASGAAMAGALAPSLFEIRPVVGAAHIEYRRPARAPLRATATTDRPGHELRTSLAADGRVDFDVAVAITDGRDRVVADFRATWVVMATPSAERGG